MSRAKYWLGWAVLMAGSCLATAVAAAPWPTALHRLDDEARPFLPGHILVRRAAGVDAAAFAAAIDAAGGRLVRHLRDSKIAEVAVPEGAEQVTVAQLRADPRIGIAEVDGIAHIAGDNDPWLAQQWYLFDVNAIPGSSAASGTGVTIAVLDTGVDPTHPDLAGHLVPGWNFYDDNADTADVMGHGTEVAGVAAAIGNNAIGIAGVAGNARIMPVRIADAQGYATVGNIAEGIIWATDHGARVVNLSFVGITQSAIVRSVAAFLRSRGGVLYVAAGNDGAMLPAVTPPVMTVVSALQPGDTLAWFSDWGPAISLAAPGVNILTTARGGGYADVQGTSFAAPIAAGTAALVLSSRPDLDPAEVDAALYGSATRLDNFYTRKPSLYYGHGKVNAAMAVALAQWLPPGTGSSGTTPDSTPPAPVAPSPQQSPPPQPSFPQPSPAPAATPPSVNFVNPGTYQRVHGIVNVTTSLLQNAAGNPVTQTLSIDNVIVGVYAGAPVAYAWNTRGIERGNHRLTVVAVNHAGQGASATVVVYH